MIEINKIELKDCEIIAQLHINYLNTPFVGDSGVKLLGMYYEILSREEGGIGFLANVDKEVAGYVCGVWDPQKIGINLAKIKFINLSYWGIRQIIVQPRSLLDFVSRLIYFRTSACRGYELRPIVISKIYRGNGIALLLVNRLKTDAISRGYDQLFLFTEEDNIAANKFYKKMGFELKSILPNKNNRRLKYTLKCG